IKQGAISYFSNIYASENHSHNNDLISKTIPSLVSGEDNLMLTNVTTMSEVKHDVFGLNGDGALGLDGFDGCFY
ncbi:hypothetical protein glysoja_028087, partial [Glycine soja]